MVWCICRPVVDERGCFVGIVTRPSLVLAMASHKAMHALMAARADHQSRKHASIGGGPGFEAEAQGLQHATVTPEKVWGIASRFARGLKADSATASPLEGGTGHGMVDLGHFMDDTPYLTRPNTPVFRVHKMFTLLGMRHIPVVDQGERVVGMITRKDLLPWVLHGALRSDVALEQGQEHVAAQDLHEQALEVRIAKLRLAVASRDAEICRLRTSVDSLANQSLPATDEADELVA